MSWSDDTRCLYCDGKLPLYRKLTNGQFCSTAHQKAYWKEQERLAVEVLHRTHDALMAYRPQGDIELIIGPAVGWNGSSAAPSVAQPTLRDEPVQTRVEGHAEPFPETAHPIKFALQTAAPPPQVQVSEPAPPPFAALLRIVSPEVASPRWTVLLPLRAEEPAPCEPVFADLLARPFRETITPPARNRLRVATNPVRVPVEAADVEWAAADATPLAIRISAPAPVASRLEPQSPPRQFVPEVEEAPVRSAPDEKQIALESSTPGSSPDAQTVRRAQAEVAPQDARSLEANDVRSRLIFVDTALEQQPAASEPVMFAKRMVIVEPVLLPEQAVEEVEQSGPIPPFAGWRHKEACLASALCTPAFVERDSVDLGFPLQSPRNPVLQAPPAEPFAAGLGPPVELSLEAAEIDPHPRLPALTWFRLGAFNPPMLIRSSLTPVEPRVRLAGGCRYAMNRPSQVPFSSPVEALTFGAVGRVGAFPALLEHERRTSLQAIFEPNLAAMVDLTAWKSEIPARALNRDSAPSRGSGQVLTFTAPAWIPALRLQPLKWVASQPSPEVPGTAAPRPVLSPALPAASKTNPQLGHLLLGFWKNAPRDLRLLMFAIPALLALAFHPTLPKVHVSTVQATEPVEKNVGQAINGSWSTFKQVVSERAAVSLDEDFRSGLDDWASPGGNATEWSFDANGFVRPGSLALYSPSMPLADYQVQFLGLIDQKSLSWVVRAADFGNYYVVKLMVRKPGPLTTLGLTRYAVINGKPQNRVDAVVPFTARPDMLYRVRMDVHDDSFVLAIQGQMVDAWSEPRLKKGGIGFFSARGEGSRVRWLQVTHQYDMLGRLCSYLAPYDLSAADVLPTETTTKNNSTKNNGSWQR